MRATHERWKKAVIHLETATDKDDHEASRKAYTESSDKIYAQVESGEITTLEGEEQIDILWRQYVGATRTTRDIRSQGTGIFLADSGQHYLITARHVVWDELRAQREFRHSVERIRTLPHIFDPAEELAREKERALNRIFNTIFRVRSYDEIMSRPTNHLPPFLMNLSAGTSFTAPYSFSAPELDLAIISLYRDSDFTSDLKENGYHPIALEDISDEPSCEGADVFTVGYPLATSLIMSLQQEEATKHWSSDFASLPVFAFGKVSMLNENLSGFWVDMSIYPGNSGGPVVEEDKLVGIVSGQSVIDVEKSNPEHADYQVRIPFAKVIKASFLRDLIGIQRDKDNFIQNPLRLQDSIG